MPYIVQKSSREMVDVRYTEQLHIELLDGDGLFLVNAVNLAFCAAAVYERGSPSDSEWNPVQDRLWQVFFKKISHTDRSAITIKNADNFKSPFINLAAHGEAVRIPVHDASNPYCVEFIDIPQADTQFLYYVSGNEIVFSIRGTQQLRDWVTNGDIAKTPFREVPGSGEVHAGFYRAFQSMARVVEPLLKHHLEKKTVFITGHSLGGALATLLACWIRARFTSNVVLYTFGAPMVGDAQFARYFGETMTFPYHRFVNSNDVVTMIPVPGTSINWDLISLLPSAGPKGVLLLPLALVDTGPAVFNHFGNLVFIGRRVGDIVSVIDASQSHLIEDAVAQQRRTAKGTNNRDDLLRLAQGAANLASDHSMGKYLSIVTAQLHHYIRRFLFARNAAESPPKTAVHDSALKKNPYIAKAAASSDKTKTAHSSISTVGEADLTTDQIYAAITSRPFDAFVQAEFEYQAGSVEEYLKGVLGVLPG